GLACEIASAALSLLKYETTDETITMTATIAMPTAPPFSRRLNAAPTSPSRITNPKMSTNVLRLFAAICSYNEDLGTDSRRQEGWAQHWTLGTSVAPCSAWKYSRDLNPNIPAMTFDGIDWILLSYFITLSL